MAQDSKSKLGGLLKPPTVWIVAALGVGAVAISLVGAQQLSEFSTRTTPTASSSAAPTPTLKFISALGRIEPQGEVIELSAAFLSEGARVDELQVEEGDRVRQGQIIAILDSRDRLEANLEQAQKEVNVRRAELAKVRAGAKRGEIAAQTAEISRLEADVQRTREAEEAKIARLRAQLRREREAKEATIARLRAQVQREKEAEQANIARLRAQLEREEEAAEATLKKVKAQLRRQTQSQRANIARLQAELDGETAANKASINRLEAEVKNAEAEFERNQDLYEQGAISGSFYDTVRLEMESDRAQLQEAQAILNRNVQTIQQEINEAKAELNRIQETGQQEINEAEANLQRTIETGREQIREAQAQLNRIVETGTEQIREARANLNQIVETGIEQVRESEANLNRIVETGFQQIRSGEGTLDQISEVRSEDVDAAEAEVERAIATVKQAEAELSLAFVRSPIDGQVLAVNTRPGERIGSDEGIVELGQTEQMYVVAEIYETDISRVRIGQKATVTSSAFTGELEGSVERVGVQIAKKDILNTDPAADTDARVVEVKIRLTPESSQKVTDLTNLQVDVRILREV